jgi:DNA-binding NarL/FixJ family response regulator
MAKNTGEDFDAVIKITSLGEFRKRPKNTVSYNSQNRNPVASQKNSFSDIEENIINIVTKNQGIKASEIAKMLNSTRKEINHYLYGSLKKLFVQDSEYKWHKM